MKPMLGVFFLQWMVTGLTHSASQARWSIFATSQGYLNLRMLISEADYSQTRRIPKEAGTLIAKMNCMTLCNNDFRCQAFNFYEMTDAYACELLSDNLCGNQLHKAFLPRQGSSIWDRLSPGSSRTCIETLMNSNNGIDCSLMRPGCTGIWPSCSNCPKTCVDCNARNTVPKCVIWPDGDGPNSVPIFAHCAGTNTYLQIRRVDPDTGMVTESYRMAFWNMNRLYKLNVYKFLHFYFENTEFWNTRKAYYRDSYIDETGNLTIMEFYSRYFTEDILKLNGQILQSVPFIKVSDDRYNCGSFWLLNPNNGSYCPGGAIAMFGTPKVDGSRVISTGIQCNSIGGVFKAATIELTNG